MVCPAASCSPFSTEWLNGCVYMIVVIMNSSNVDGPAFGLAGIVLSVRNCRIRQKGMGEGVTKGENALDYYALIHEDRKVQTAFPFIREIFHHGGPP